MKAVSEPGFFAFKDSLNVGLVAEDNEYCQ